MKRLLQWLFGYVRVIVCGKQMNRFLNLCSKNGIRIWRVAYEAERKVKMNIRLKDFYLLRPFLRKTKTRLRIIKKRGFPFWCHRHPYMKWFLALGAVLLVVFFYSRTFIWNIDIDGNKKVSQTELMDYLASENIKPGIAGKNVDCSALELKIRQKYEGIGWVSVYVDQTNLRILIKESLYEPLDEELSLEQEQRRYDLVAQRDGKIISIVTRSGTPLVKAGDEVKKGQTLVQGTYEVLDDTGVVKSVQMVYADALIIAESEYIIPFSVSEMEILGANIAGNYEKYENSIFLNPKLRQIFLLFDENGVIIMRKNVMIESKEKSITIYIHVVGQSLMGIHVPVEKGSIHESE